MTDETSSTPDEQHQLAREFADKLADFPRKASTFMAREAVWTALIASAIAFAKQQGVAENVIRNELRAVADDLEAGDPPRSAVN